MLRSPDLSRNMNPDLLVDALAERFDGDPYRPGADRAEMGAVVAAVPGMSTTYSLSVVADAVSLMGDDEVYLEVGTYRGRSLVGALLGNPAARGIGIENFGEFGGDRSTAARDLAGHLAAFGVAGRARVLEGDAFRLLPRLALPRPVGVYLYDGVHSAYGQYAGLGLAEHLLADRAVVLVDDASWPQVANATDAYAARHPGYRLLADFTARRQDDPLWCNGMRVYAWERPAGWRPGASADVRIRALLQSRVTGPARTLAWQVLGDHPRLMEQIRRVVVRGGTTVSGGDGEAEG